MKLKLKEKEMPPVQLRLVLSAKLKGDLDQYIAFVRERSGREVECREVAVEMLGQFVESDREFRQWQKRTKGAPEGRRLSGVESGSQVNGQASA
jgi:hypothetical protein